MQNMQLPSSFLQHSTVYCNWQTGVFGSIYVYMCLWECLACLYMDILKIIISYQVPLLFPDLSNWSWCMSALIVRIYCLHPAGMEYAKFEMLKNDWNTGQSHHLSTDHILNSFADIVIIWGTGGVLHLVRLLFHRLKAFITCLIEMIVTTCHILYLKVLEEHTHTHTLKFLPFVNMEMAFTSAIGFAELGRLFFLHYY